jgi:hypothetical protein
MTQANQWIVKNFSKLVDRYGGRCIAVVKNKVVAIGKDEKSVEKAARLKHPKIIPSVLRVPKPQELVCVLNFRIRIIKA